MQDGMRMFVFLFTILSKFNWFSSYRMHHACAVQRIELVQLYLSCLDFHIEAQDCEGNTCLHYVAITGK